MTKCMIEISKLTGLRVIMGDYYVELIIDIKVKRIPMIRRPEDNIRSMTYNFRFSRSGYVYITREALMKDSKTLEENNVIVDGSTNRPLASGLYEYFIIKSTFYKMLTYYIFNFLNN